MLTSATQGEQDEDHGDVFLHFELVFREMKRGRVFAISRSERISTRMFYGPYVQDEFFSQVTVIKRP